MSIENEPSTSPIKPITPTEVASAKSSKIPDEVIKAFNDLIVTEWDGHSAVIHQDEICTLVAERLKVKRQTVFANKWLDVEDIFRQAGWKVEYDKPGYNETYEATFTFSKP